MNADFGRAGMNPVTDVYTDLNGMQALRAEKDQDLALKKVAQQFESMFVNMLLKNMRAANKVFNEDGLFDSQESAFYQDMHDNQLALTMSHGRGFGIAEAMYRQMSSNYGSGNTAEKAARAQQSTPLYASPNQSILPLSPLLTEEKTALQKVRSEQDEMLAVNSLSKPHDLDPKHADVMASGDGRSALATSPSDFIEKVKHGARIAARALGVEEEMLIAQAALETGWGQHVFAKENGESTFNVFNIKADQRWQGDAVQKNTLEFLGGQFNNMAAKFRSYASIEDSFKDFSHFITTNQRYDKALDVTASSVDFLKSIHQAGYATDPHYVEKVTAVYKQVKAILSSDMLSKASP